MEQDVRVEVLATGETILWLRERMLPTKTVCELGVALEHHERVAGGNAEEVAGVGEVAGDVPRRGGPPALQDVPDEVAGPGVGVEQESAVRQGTHRSPSAGRVTLGEWYPVGSRARRRARDAGEEPHPREVRAERWETWPLARSTASTCRAGSRSCSGRQGRRDDRVDGATTFRGPRSRCAVEPDTKERGARCATSYRIEATRPVPDPRRGRAAARALDEPWRTVILCRRVHRPAVV
jgi:hypothetical protein